MVNIGIDAGYGAFKAGRVIQDGQKFVTKTTLVASIIGVGDTELGVFRGLGKEPKKVTFGGQTILVGEEVPRWATPIQRTDFGRFWEISTEFLALLYAVLANLFPPGTHDVNILLGLPVTLAISSEARTLVGTITQKLCTEHSFSIGRRSYTFRIHSVKAVPQPFGAQVAWLLNDEGTPAQSEELSKALIGVCDIGFNTCDLFASEEGKPIRRYIGGLQLGVNDVFRFVQEELYRLTGVRFSPAELDPYIRGAKTTMIVAKKTYNVAQIVSRAVDTIGLELIQFINGLWGNPPFAVLLIVGGGAYLFGDRLKAQYVFAEVPPDPIMTNAIGLARYAHWKGDKLFPS